MLKSFKERGGGGCGRMKEEDVGEWKREMWENGRGRCGRMKEGVNLIKIYFKHICKFHNESPRTAYIC
jgi:hypothetical protein